MNSSGWVSINSSLTENLYQYLSYEIQAGFNLRVSVSDAAGSGLETVGTIVINLGPVNDPPILAPRLMAALTLPIVILRNIVSGFFLLHMKTLLGFSRNINTAKSPALTEPPITSMFLPLNSSVYLIGNIVFKYTKQPKKKKNDGSDDEEEDGKKSNSKQETEKEEEKIYDELGNEVEVKPLKILTTQRVPRLIRKLNKQTKSSLPADEKHPTVSSS
jgi:hypothetical protein